MSTTTLAFDGFDESAKHDFVESPHNERDSSGTLLTYVNDVVGNFAISHGRKKLALTDDVGGVIGSARGPFDETFLRSRYLAELTDGTTTWNEETITKHYNKWDGSTEADEGTSTGSIPGYTIVSLASSGVITDTASEVKWRKVRNVTVGGVAGTLTEEIIYDEPYLYDDLFDDAVALYTAKYSGWAAAAPAFEFWSYDSAGGIQSGPGVWGAVWPIATEHAGFAASVDAAYPDGVLPLTVLEIRGVKLKFNSTPAIADMNFSYTTTLRDYSPGCEQPGTVGAITRIGPVLDDVVYTINPDNVTDYHTVTQTAHTRAISYAI